MEASSRRVNVQHGLSLNLLEWSQGGTALLFLHGFDNDLHVWDDFAPLVAPYYRTLALDHRGHGESDWDPERRYDHETMAGDVNAVLEGLGIERVVIVGHSLGGRIAMRFAHRHPEKLAGLVLIDVGPELDTRGTTRITLEVQTSDPTYASQREFELVLAQRYPEAERSTLSRLAGHWLRERPDGRFEPRRDPGFGRPRSEFTAEEAREYSKRESEVLWEALRKTLCPTLVVRGAASDILDPDVAERMAEEELPNGQLSVISRSSHSVMLDNPKEFGEALTGFVLGED